MSAHIPAPPNHRAIRSPFFTRAAFCFLLSAFCFSVPAAPSVTVWGFLHDVDDTGLSTYINFTPPRQALISSLGLSVGIAHTFSITNGVFTNRLDAGDYWVTLPLNQWKDPFMISVPSFGGPYNITNLLSDPTTYGSFIMPADVTNIVLAIGVASGPTNGIQQLNGSGTNTALNNPAISSGTIASSTAISSNNFVGQFVGNATGLTNVGAASIASGVLPTLNIRAAPWNAAGDGVTDDRAAFQYASDYIWTNGSYGGIYVPVGVYKLSSGINFQPNHPAASGSGNGLNSTNKLEIFGQGDGSVLWLTATNKNCLNLLTTNTPMFFTRPYIHDLCLYGAGWSGTPNSNAGVQTNFTTSAGIFAGIPGPDAGIPGFIGAVIERVKIMWFANGVVCSNSVSLAIRESQIAENMTNDVLLAHVDTSLIDTVLGGSVLNGNLQHHAMIRITGTGLDDPGNGCMLTGGWECNGTAVEADGPVSLIVEGGDVESNDQFQRPPFIMHGPGHATFINNYSGSTNIFFFDNPGFNCGGYTIINPAWWVGTGTRMAQIIVSNTDGTLSFPKLINTGNSGLWDSDNTPNQQNTLFLGPSGSGLWVNLPDFDRMPWHNGCGTVVGGDHDQNWYLGMLWKTNFDKAFSLTMPSFTNGWTQTGTNMNTPAELGILSAISSTNVDWLMLGTDGRSNQAVTGIKFMTASTKGGIANTNMELDTGGNLIVGKNVVAGGLFNTGNGFDPDATNFFAVAGITRDNEKSAIDYLCKSLKATNLWSLMDVIYPFVGLSSNAASLNLKNPATFPIAWTNVGTGILFQTNGVTSTTTNGTAYGIGPACSSFSQWSLNSAHMSAFLGAPFTGFSSIYGTVGEAGQSYNDKSWLTWNGTGSAATSGINGPYWSGGGTLYAYDSTSGAMGGPLIGSRTNSTTGFGLGNVSLGLYIQSPALTGAATIVPTTPIGFFCDTYDGSARENASAGTLRCVTMGAGLTTQQALELARIETVFNSLVTTNYQATASFQSAAAFPQQPVAPTAGQIGGTVGSITNHLLMNVTGGLMDYWSDGAVLYSNALANRVVSTNVLQQGISVTNEVVATATGFVVDASRATQSIVTNNNFTIAGIDKLLPGFRWQGSVAVSNSAASTIWGTNTPSCGLIGSVSTNALAIPAGKWGYFSFDALTGVWTNGSNATQQ